MSTKEFEGYLAQLQRTGASQAPLRNIKQFGALGNQVVGDVNAKRKERSDTFLKMIQLGYEPIIKDAQGNKVPVDNNIIMAMKNGDDIAVDWQKSVKAVDEEVLPADWQIEGLKRAGYTIPPGSKVSKKWLESTLKPVARRETSISIDEASPEQISAARSLIRGDILTSNLGMRDRGFITQLAVSIAEKEGIPFKSYQGDVRKGTAQNLAYGKMGNMALALNTGIGHAGDALSAYENVKNTDIKMLNRPINALKKETNDPNIIALELNINALAGELATIFKGSAGTDQEIKHWLSVLTPDLTPTQAQAALKKVAELLTSRQNALVYQQKNVMQQPVGERQIVSPKSQGIMQKIGGEQSEQGGLTPEEESRYQELMRKSGRQ